MDLISRVPLDEPETWAVTEVWPRKTLIKIGFSLLGAASLVILFFSFYPFEKQNLVHNPLALLTNKEEEKKVDDWQYQPSENSEGFIKKGLNKISLNNRISSSAGMMAQSFSLDSAASMGASESIGYAVGGAKDINNFRENINNGYLPLPTDVTYEGLFYDYYFNTGKKQDCAELFCPAYSWAVSKDPLSGAEEYYLAVGLNSNIKEKDFKRKKLNLAVVLDISGSMGSPFDRYYYDQFGNQQQTSEKQESNKSKMEIAAQSVTSLINHLNPEDRFGMVLFNDEAFLAKPMSSVAQTDLASIKKHILEIDADGGTNMSAGLAEGTKLFKEFISADSSEYENRIIFLTDAMPNLGETAEDGLLGLTKQNAADKINSTFIGIGVDFNTELVEALTKIRGANYYSVHSADEFTKRMDNEFDYMVTPLVYNLNLSLAGAGFKIDKVYGSPEANEATGELMKVNTLFPSKQENGQIKGGLILLKLTKTSSDTALSLKISYEDRSGRPAQSQQNLNFPVVSADYYDNLGIRKGILLARYANLLKNWMIDERSQPAEPRPWPIEPLMLEPSVNFEDGIIMPPSMPEYILGQWERQSSDLRVSAQYQEIFSRFKGYFASEALAVKDSALDQEIKLLDKLLQVN